MREQDAPYLKGTREPGRRAPRKPRPAYLLSDKLMTVYETPRPKLSDPGRVYKHLEDLKDENREVMVVICVTAQNRGILREIIHIGLVDQCNVSSRELLKPAILNSASGIIIAHNHPGGNPSPSEADITTTKMIESACTLFNIRLLDHVIFAHDAYFSMQAAGFISEDKS
ncbi:MAG: JAB domain-containing protein [Solidesulfovibrio sp. DCME]|uniref:JAB domain-containing protein n=1 Tax=Solidesulfovibrio sp. DCME TaxID=3447380 RepID=UPI003D1115AA